MIQLRAWNSTDGEGYNDCVDDSVMIQMGALNGMGREDACLHGAVMSQLRAFYGAGVRGEDNYPDESVMVQM